MSANKVIPLQQNITQIDLRTDMEFRDIISDSTRFYIELYLSGVITSLLSVFGIVANIVNFIVFMKQKTNDCVTICLRSLTISDFCAIVATLGACLCALTKCLNPGLTIDPVALLFLMQYGRAMCFDISMATTAFISVERCLCVVMPFHFKNTFTPRVAVITLFIIYVYTIGSYIPSLMSQGLWSVWDPAYNKTRVTLWLAYNRGQIDKFSNIFTHIIAATIFQIIVVISTYVMVLGLRRSAKFRRSMMTTTNKSTPETGQTVFTVESNSTSENNNNNSSNNNNNNDNNNSNSNNNSNNSTQDKNSNVADVSKRGLSSTSKSVSKMVSILTTIFFVCNFFRLAVVYARRIYPDINPVSYLRNSYFAMFAVWKFIGAVNCSVNCFVYYAHSVNYRSIFLKTFFTSHRHSS